MDQKAKRKMASNAVYILTAVIVISIMCMTLYTSFNTARGSSDSAAVTSPGAATQADLSIPESAAPAAAPETEAAVAPAETEAVKAVMNEDVAAAGNPGSAPEYVAPVYMMPVNSVISKSYDDTVPVFSATMNDYRVHAGIDIEADVGSAVYACADGVITNIYDDPFWGSCLTVTHGDGLVSTYMNLSPERPAGIDQGVSVSVGDLIGAVGETALIEIADSPHLHFEMKLNGGPVNPLSYIPYDEATAVSALSGD